MIGGLSLRPRVALPSPLPNLPRTPLPSSASSSSTPIGRLPSALAGGTRVITQDSQKSSTFRHTASELLPVSEPSPPRRKTALFVGIGVAGIAAAAAILLTQPGRNSNRGGTEKRDRKGRKRRPPPRLARPGSNPPAAPSRPRCRPRSPPRWRRRARPAPDRIQADERRALGGRGEPAPGPDAARRRAPSQLVAGGRRAQGPRLRRFADSPNRSRAHATAGRRDEQENTKGAVKSASKNTSKDSSSRRHSSHGSPKQPSEHPPAKPENGYFGVGD